MNKIRKIIIWTMLLVCLCSFAFSGCGKKNEAINHFYITSSDKKLDTFVNEYFLRHVREGEMSNGDLKIGYGPMYFKEWETMSLNWHNSAALSGDRMGKVRYYMLDFPCDKFGFMWCSSYELNEVTCNAGNYGGQGWPFPTARDSKGEALHYEFNSRSVENWTATNGATFTADGSGVATARYKGKVLELVSPDMNVDTFHSPFIEMDIRIQDMLGYGEDTDLKDLKIAWQTEETGNEWFSVSQDFCTLPVKMTASYVRKMYFPMYLNENWDNHHVTKFKIIIESKSDTSEVKCDLSYVRFAYDTRQSINNCWFIDTVKNYLDYNDDVDFLKKEVVRTRSAMTFLLEHLKGKSGILDVSYLYGHDGKDNTDDSWGHSIGNGYWDIYMSLPENLEANTYFYKALLNMACIEDRIKAHGITVGDVSVVSPDGKGRVTYGATAESLRALAETVKENITKKFWNEERGRFIYGYQADGDMMDYGYIQFNCEAITAGLASPEQQTKIMDWISGKRIVAGDTSTGEDIYAFDFAPRTTTKKNKVDYGWWGWNGKNMPFGNQVQDGGVIMYVSYYDLMSRTYAYGIDDSFERFKKIEDWYYLVKSAGGEGLDFYRDYYAEINVGLQGGGSLGGIGLDYEFLESCLLYDYVPHAILGINASKINELEFTPRLPKGLDNVTLHNMYYNGMVYDVTIKKDSVKIEKIKNYKSGTKLTVYGSNGEKTVDFKETTVKY